MTLRRLGLALLAVALGACGPTTTEPDLTSIDRLNPIDLSPGRPLQIVASTSILADVVANVGGSRVDVRSLVPLGVDPHAFEPSPREARSLAEADVVFVAGFGLESFLDDLLRGGGGTVTIVELSPGIEALAPGGGPETDMEGPIDPHVWLDPANVEIWADNLEAALSALDPDHAQEYNANAAAYRDELRALDRDLRRSAGEIPADRRILLTDHDDLGYFARAYGFTVVGTVIPGSSSLAEPSAIELARLLDAVRASGVTAIFVSSVGNRALMESFAADAGLRVELLVTHSLTPADGPGPTYLEMMRTNGRAIVAALGS